MSAYIKTLKNTDGDIIYPQTKTSAVFTNDGVNIESIFGNPALIDGSAPIIDTTMNVNADTLQNKNWSQMLTNKNLLDNWDFRNPVNQRGQTSYTGLNSRYEYTVDRWAISQYNTNLVVTVNDGYITLSNSGDSTQYYVQKMERFIDINNPYTLSAKTHNGVILCATNGMLYSDVWGMMVDQSANGVAIFVSPNSSVSFDIVKLELGSISTLANDPPADYGTELAKCQRYCIMYGQYAQWLYTDIQLNYIDFTIQIPASMRTTPSIVNSNNFAILGQTGFSFSVVAYSVNNIRLRATKTNHGVTNAILEINGLGGFSADL